MSVQYQGPITDRNLSFQNEAKLQWKQNYLCYQNSNLY